jgi:hypothetical protein
VGVQVSGEVVVGEVWVFNFILFGAFSFGDLIWASFSLE